MSKLKLDLHDIYNDGTRIELALANILDEAESKRIEEVEIIPGKGSGALKKTVLRFLDRPDVRSRYHRVVKDGENWGRLFVHFRWQAEVRRPARVEAARVTYPCFCCGGLNPVVLDQLPVSRVLVCPGCGSPNKITVRETRSGPQITAESGYE